MKSSNVLVLITIVYLSCEIVSARKYPSDILTKPKDDCGNVCGEITKDTKSTCGDQDKREDKILIVHEQLEDGKTDYFETRALECVGTCPANYKMYEKTNVCVKDPARFKAELAEDKKEEEEKKETIEDQLDYTWWIVGGVGALLVVAIGVVFVLFKKRSG